MGDSAPPRGRRPASPALHRPARTHAATAHGNGCSPLSHRVWNVLRKVQAAKEELTASARRSKMSRTLRSRPWAIAAVEQLERCLRYLWRSSLLFSLAAVPAPHCPSRLASDHRHPARQPDGAPEPAGYIQRAGHRRDRSIPISVDEGRSAHWWGQQRFLRNARRRLERQR